MHSGLLSFCLAAAAVAAPPSISPRRPAVPPGDASNPVDRFVGAYFEKKKVAWRQPVSDAAFARRAWLDIWGLLPTPEQLDAFLADRGPQNRARLVDRLLADRHNYAEHWISFWNDLLRNDEGVVYHGTRQSITSWLYAALEKNLPYDRFVSELLDPAKGGPEGFLVGVNWRGEVSASQIPAMQAAQNSAQVFLGVNLKCNSCHDSFISKWKLKDAYGLASFFAEEPLAIHRCDVKTGESSQPRFLYPELGGVAAEAALAERRAAAARLFTGPDNGRLPRTLVNRVWDRLFGRGIVSTVDDMDRIPWDPDLLDWLAADFADHGYDIQHLLRRILTARAYQLPAMPRPKGGEAYVFRGPYERRLSAEQFVDAVSSLTGEWRVLQPRQAGTGAYTRDWRFKSSPLTRALGRPIRDQVFTQRDTEATTLQALELVNGESLQALLRRGARRMLGQLRPPPPNIYDSGVLSSGTATIDIDITGATRLWLLLADADSYDPLRVAAGWAEAGLSGPGGAARLADLAPGARARQLQFRNRAAAAGVTAPLDSELVLDLAGRGFTRFRAVAGVDESSLKSDISPRVRFFVFREEPDRDQLVRVAGEPPVAWKPEKFTTASLGARVFRHALGRDPAPAERRIAAEFLGPRPNPEGLEDLLWSVLLSPEFQYIR
jgi:hypothetical protein